MSFTSDEQQEIIEIVNKLAKEGCAICSSEISREDHIASHRFLIELQKTIAFVSEVKKGVLILVLGGFVLFVGGALLTGLAIVISAKVPVP